MRKFNLILRKEKEVISKVLANSFEEALEYFCQVKKLKAKDLLEIYTITE